MHCTPTQKSVTQTCIESTRGRPADMQALPQPAHRLCTKHQHSSHNGVNDAALCAVEASAIRYDVWASCLPVASAQVVQTTVAERFVQLCHTRHGHQSLMHMVVQCLTVPKYSKVVTHMILQRSPTCMATCNRALKGRRVLFWSSSPLISLCPCAYA